MKSKRKVHSHAKQFVHDGNKQYLDKKRSLSVCLL